MTKNYPFIIRR